jgi:large subunit ribosomal protein L25
VPSHFDADLAPLDINGNIRWSDLQGTEGIRPVIIDRDFVIATVAPPTKIAEPTAETAAVAGAPTPAAGAAAPAAGAPTAAAAAPAGRAAAPAKGGRDGGKKK